MIFSKDLYFQGIKKIKTSGIGYAAIIIVLNLLYAFSERGHYYSGNPVFEPKSEPITGGALAPFTPLMLFFASRMVTSMFSFLNERKGSDFFHSIPYKRICVYLSLIASVCTWIVGIVFLTILLNGISFGTGSYYTVSIPNAFLTFLGHSVSALVIAGITAVARMVSGTSASCFLYTISFLAAPRLLLLLFEAFLESFNPSIILEKTWLKFFTMDVSFYFVLGEMYNDELGRFGDIWLHILLIVEVVLLFAVAAYLYVRRNSELAEQNSPSKVIQILFRTAATAPILCYAFANIVFKEEFLFCFILIVVSALAYFIFELILSKSILNSIKALPWFALPLLLSAVIAASSYGIAEGFKATNPEFDEIESFELVMIDDYSWPRDEYYNIPIKEEWAKKIVFDGLKKACNSDEGIYYTDTNVKFNLKDGSTKYRKVRINYNYSKEKRLLVDLLEILSSDTILNKIPAASEFVEIDVEFNLPNSSKKQFLKISKEEYIKEIAETFAEEYNPLMPTEKKEITNGKHMYYGNTWESGNIADVNITFKNKTRRFSLYSMKTPKTILKVIECFYEENNKEYISEFKDSFNPNKSNSKVYPAYKVLFPEGTFNKTHFNIVCSFDTKEAQSAFYNSLDEKALSDFSDLSKVYVIWDNDLYYFISLTDNQVDTLKYRNGEPSDYSENAE